MLKDDAFIGDRFEHSGEANQTAVPELVAALTGFLDHFGVKSLVGHSFVDIIGNGDGGTPVGQVSGCLRIQPES
jgi:hypothetical protein